MKIINYIAAICIAAFLTGCFKEEIELDLNDNNERLSIEAWITDLDEQQSVTLSLTADYLDFTEPTYIDDASVKIMYNQEEFDFNSVGNGLFLLPSDWRAEVNTEYTLQVTYDGEVYEATSLMRAMPTLDDIRSEFYETRDSIDYYDIYFGFQETEGEGDGYYGVDYKKGTMTGDTLLNGGFTNDEFGDGTYFSDVTLTNEGYEIGDTVILQTFSIGIDASNYLQDILIEVFREGFFDPPPVNVRSNFTNGAVGYFIASGASKHEVIVEE